MNQKTLYRSSQFYYFSNSLKKLSLVVDTVAKITNVILQFITLSSWMN